MEVGGVPVGEHLAQLKAPVCHIALGELLLWGCSTQTAVGRNTEQWLPVSPRVTGICLTEAECKMDCRWPLQKPCLKFLPRFALIQIGNDELEDKNNSFGFFLLFNFS